MAIVGQQHRDFQLQQFAKELRVTCALMSWFAWTHRWSRRDSNCQSRCGRSNVFDAARAPFRRSRTRNDSRPGKSPEGKLDGGGRDEGGQAFGEVLEVLGETPVSSEPGEGRCVRTCRPGSRWRYGARPLAELDQQAIPSGLHQPAI